MFDTPILLIIFNRPNTTIQVFEAIRKIRPYNLYIASDAPRKGIKEDEQKCSISRSITENIDWPCKVMRLYQKENLGCSLGPIAAFDWFFSKVTEGIILEDDCVPNLDFFTFTAAMLERYRHNYRIISINGSNLGYKLVNGDSYTYSRFMNMWGWATWADRAQAIDYSLAEWARVKHPLWFLYRRLSQRFFDLDINWFKYWQHKFDLTVNKEFITWWDWQWVYHQLTRGQLSIVPAVNLITNVGFDSNGTHTHEVENPAANMPTKVMHSELIYPVTIEPDFVYEEVYIKWVWCYHKRLPILFYLKQLISLLVNKIKI